MARPWRRLALYYIGGLLLAGVLAMLGYWWVPSPESVVLPFVLLVMSWVLTSLLEWNARRTPRTKVFSAHPQAKGFARDSVLVMAMPSVEVREAAKQAAGRLPRARLAKRRDGQLVFRVPGSWGRSYGQLVSIDIADQQAGTRVRVSSRPLMATTAGDNGRNQANVDTVVSLLEEADQRYQSSREHPD